MQSVQGTAQNLLLIASCTDILHHIVVHLLSTSILRGCYLSATLQILVYYVFYRSKNITHATRSCIIVNIIDNVTIILSQRFREEAVSCGVSGARSHKTDQGGGGRRSEETKTSQPQNQAQLLYRAPG